jgi:LPXTG-motif cell wall-anchored protein
MHSTTAQWRNAALLVVCLAAPAAAASAQQSTTTSETKHFQVISVEGNKVVAKLPEGAREITVPEDFRFTVDGREVSVHELQPGMKGTAKITTITTVTPVTVTEVRNGEVMQASGSSIIVKSANGIKMFTEGDIAKRNVTILKDGKPASIADFHTGDRLTATIVTEKPPKVMTQRQVQATLAGATPTATTGATPAARTAAAPAAAAPAPTTGTAAAPARKLPKTASQVPLLGLLGALSLAIALGLRLGRRRQA